MKPEDQISRKLQSIVNSLDLLIAIVLISIFVTLVLK